VTASGPAEADGALPAGRGRTVLIATSAVVLLGLAGAGVVVATSGGDTTSSNRPASTSADVADPSADDALAQPVPSPERLVAAPTADGVRFTWANPDPQPGDSYVWGRTDPGADPALTLVSEPQVTVPATGQVCIQVQLRRTNGRVSDQPATGCAS
jgi:hypothetical protein